VSLEGHALREIAVSGGTVVGVATDAATLDADVVVNCAGGWIAALEHASGTGRALPLQPVRHQLVVTQPLAAVGVDDSSVRVVDANVYTRPCWGGLIFGGYESKPLFLASDALPRSVTDLPLDASTIEELRTRVAAEFAILENAAIRELRGGIPTLTADGLPVLDEVPGARGHFIVGGCNVGGLSTSPAVGEAMAQWIVTGVRPPVLRPFGLTRFAAAGHDALLASARQQYASAEYG
jgi:4-methylaminobutanoate oxidase (formaldehyde-forming)